MDLNYCILVNICVGTFMLHQHNNKSIQSVRHGKYQGDLQQYFKNVFLLTSKISMWDKLKILLYLKQMLL